MTANSKKSSSKDKITMNGFKQSNMYMPQLLVFFAKIMKTSFRMFSNSVEIIVC